MDAVVQDVLDWLSKHYTQESAVIASAPIALVVCVALIGVILFLAIQWHFHHQISGLEQVNVIHEERHKLKDEKLAALSDLSLILKPLRRMISAKNSMRYETDSAICGLG